MVELAFPLSAISEKVSNNTVEITPSAKNEDGEKSVGVNQLSDK